MPIYEYACVNCSLSESRIAGLDDHTVKCTSCGYDMERLTEGEDLFRAYWEKSDRSPDRNVGSS